MGTSLTKLAREALALCETAEVDGTEDQLADALEVVDALADALGERIRKAVEEADARQSDRAA